MPIAAPSLLNACRYSLAIVISLALLTCPAGATQYDLTTLNTPFNIGEAYGIYRGQVAGAGTLQGSAWWPTPESAPVSLNPAGFSSSIAWGIGGNQQVGQATIGGNRHAFLWTGTAASAVNLTPNTLGWADATDGAQQVGVAGGGAALWTGTAASHVSLAPPVYGYSEAQAVWNGIQVGWGAAEAGTNNADALLWRGSASSYVVLKPGGKAFGISRGQVVGWWENQAAIWSGYTPDTFVNVNPSNATASELFATNGTQQVGDVSLTIGSLGQLPVDHHPGVWRGTVSSFEMLPLPQGDNYGVATGIDGDGNISGTVGTQNFGTIGNFLPVLWVPHRLVGDDNLDGAVNFSDLLVLAQHYGKPGEWVDGDFNGDGMIGFGDLLALAQNYGESQSAMQYSVVAAVPEPSILALASPACFLLVYRRR